MKLRPSTLFDIIRSSETADPPSTGRRATIQSVLTECHPRKFGKRFILSNYHSFLGRWIGNFINSGPMNLCTALKRPCIYPLNIKIIICEELVSPLPTSSQSNTLGEAEPATLNVRGALGNGHEDRHHPHEDFHLGKVTSHKDNLAVHIPPDHRHQK